MDLIIKYQSIQEKILLFFQGWILPYAEIIIFLAALSFRLVLFSGYGLGDDGNYCTAFSSITRTGKFDFNDHYQHRYGIAIPVVVSMQILGETEYGFIGAILFASCALLFVVYGLARQEWGRNYALLAMIFFAVLPLDVLCSTLFSTDEIVAAYGFSALYFFRKSFLDLQSKISTIFYAIISGCLIFLAFLSKPWVVLFIPAFVGETLINYRRSLLSAYITLLVAILPTIVYLAWQYIIFDDPLFHISIERSVAIFSPYSWEVALAYPRMLLLRNEYGSFFAGFYPHALILLSTFLLPRLFRIGKWPLYFLLMLWGLFGLPSHIENGNVMVLVPIIFRYMCMLSVPLCLALTALIRAINNQSHILTKVIISILIITSIFECISLTEPTRQAFGSARQAIKIVRTFPDYKLYSDHQFNSRYFHFQRNFGFDLHNFVNLSVENKDLIQEEIDAIDEGIVVSGGARLPWYGNPNTVFRLNEKKIPIYWEKIATFVDPQTSLDSTEPLQIWFVSRAKLQSLNIISTVESPDFIDEKIDDLRYKFPNKFATLGNLLENRTSITARDNGRILDIADAALEMQKYTLAVSKYESILREAQLDPAHRMRAIRGLAFTESRRHNFDKAKLWARQCLDMGMGAETDFAILSIEFGFDEAIALYHNNWVLRASVLFDRIASTSLNIELVKQSMYFKTLSIYKTGDIPRGNRARDEYHKNFGDTEGYVELLFREAQGVIFVKKTDSIKLLESIINNYPYSLWASEAKKLKSSLISSNINN